MSSAYLFPKKDRQKGGIIKCDERARNVDYASLLTARCCVVCPQVSASDPDCGVNSVVNYTLSENSGPFSIGSATGEICLAKPLDYETHKLYEFPVMATDRGE